MQKQDRVCIIGAGPSGMAALYQYAKLETENRPEVVCYEKQDTWGGMWNLTWMTGTDEYGEVCHGGMYKHLWINAPKECVEWKDYTFKEHFKKAVPSYLPRAPMRQYMESLWTHDSTMNLESYIKFNNAVRYVQYDEKNDSFHIAVNNLKEGVLVEETFSHVICAVGIFSAPYKPAIPGIENFHGRIIHAHDFRDAREFKGQRILVVGGSFSAEDVSIQCIKYEAKSILCSWHTKPMKLKWPKGITEVPKIKRILPNGVIFENDETADVDAIIFCTGYLYKFPFMQENLQLKSGTSFYPDNLYKGVVWMKGGNRNMFYIGVQNQLYTLPMFNVQAAWIWRFMSSSLTDSSKAAADMKADIEKWLGESSKVASKQDAIEFQSHYLDDLIEAVGLDKTITKARVIMHSWLNDRNASIATFRDKNYASIYTNQMAMKTTPWMQNFAENEY